MLANNRGRAMRIITARTPAATQATVVAAAALIPKMDPNRMVTLARPLSLLAWVV